MATVLALDVGGTKLAAAVVDDTGRVLGRGRVPSPTGTDPEQLYEALLACAAAALRGADVIPGDLDGIGVAAAGPMVWPSGEVSPLNMPAWRSFPLRKRLATEFACDRVLIHNDAVGLTVGEHWKGAGSGTSNLLGVTVSTGVGGGLILDGRLYHGFSGNAGHVGHVVVELDGPPCACGGRGCLEAIASGPNTVRHALDDGWRPRPGTRSPCATWPGPAGPSGRRSPPAPACSTSRWRPSSAASPSPARPSGSRSTRRSPPTPASRSRPPAGSSPASWARRPACSARPPSCSTPIAMAGTPTRPRVTRMGSWLRTES